MIPAKIVSTLIAVFHFVVVAVVLYGWFAVFWGRFLRFHKRDYYVYAFYFSALGQIVSELSTGTCILTDMERALRQGVDPNVSYSTGFLQHYFPFLPTGFVDSVGICTLVALAIATIQVVIALRRSRSSST